MSKKLEVPDYCSQHLDFYRAETFEEVIKRLEELSQEHSTDVFDEVVVSVSLGRNCKRPDKMPTLYFFANPLQSLLKLRAIAICNTVIHPIC